MIKIDLMRPPRGFSKILTRFYDNETNKKVLIYNKDKNIFTSSSFPRPLSAGKKIRLYV